MTEVIDEVGPMTQEMLEACEKASSAKPHCATCICGRRATVQADPHAGTGMGSISWLEFLEAWSKYAARYGTSQSPERINERSGFSFGEVTEYLGREPSTWRPGP